MKLIYEEALAAYIDMLEIHIDTKTKYPVFHAHTDRFYKTIFHVAHKIGERHVDLGWSLRDDTLVQKEQAALKIIGDLRKMIEVFSTDNDLSLWTASLLADLANDLEEIEGSAKAFL